MCNINLFSLLQNNPTVGGTWTQIISSGNSVVPIVNNIINTDNINDGTYEFRYTVSNAACTDTESVYIVVADGLSNIIMPVCGNYVAAFNIFTAFPSYYESQHGNNVSISSGYSLSYATGSPTSSAINLTTGSVDRTGLSINTTYTINVNLNNTANGCTCVSSISLYAFGCSVVTLINTNCVLTYTSTCYSPVTATGYLLQKFNTATNAFEIIFNATFPYTIPQGEDGDYRILAVQDVQLLPSMNLISCNTVSNVITAQCIPQMCDDCNLTMSITGGIGTLSAGNLTSNTCTVGNYLIDWYLNSVSPANLIFSSANSSNTDPDADLYHPMTGSGAVPTIGGTYIPRIRYVVLDSVLYSPILNFPNSTHSPDLETCLSNAVVTDFECSNGSSSSLYSHNISYVGTNNPTGITTRTIKYFIESSTEYLAYSIVGNLISDRFVFRYYSANTNTFSTLEDLVVGDDVVSNVTSTPKLIKSSTAVRGMVELPTYGAGNYVEIKVIPGYAAPTNGNTNWGLQLKCLDSFDCVCNLPTAYSPTLAPVQSCVNTACSTELRLVAPSLSCNHYSYLGVNVNSNSLVISNTQGNFFGPQGTGLNLACTAIIGSVTYTKTNNVVVVSFTNQGTYNTYKAQAIAQFAHACVNSTNNTLPSFYNYLQLYIRLENVCGDSAPFQILTFSGCVTPVYNDTTYTITITATSITFNLSYGPCDDTLNIVNIVDSINTTVTSANFTHTRQVADVAMFRGFQFTVQPFGGISSRTFTRAIRYIPELFPSSILNCGLVANCNTAVAGGLLRQIVFIVLTLERTSTINVCENYRLYLKPLTQSGCVDTAANNVLIYELENNIQIFP